jgi:hypothetical protein
LFSDLKPLIQRPGNQYLPFFTGNCQTQLPTPLRLNATIEIIGLISQSENISKKSGDGRKKRM